MTPENQAGNVANFCGAIGNIARDLVNAGVPPEPLAAALRIEAGKVEARGDRAVDTPEEAELLELAGKAHEFVNVLQVAGIDERTAVSTLANAAIERVVRSHGKAGAADWLRRLAGMIDTHGDAIELSARHR